MNTMFFGYYFGKLSVATTDGSKPEKGDWCEIDPSSLTTAQQQLYHAYKDAYAIAKDAKASFEASVRRDAGFVVRPNAKPIARKGRSLADYLADQR